eukprot:gene5542-5778_t
MASDESSFRLTQLSHGGGCGCKIAPAKLQQILGALKLDAAATPNLLVGAATSDDAAVYKVNEDQAVVLTTDFFMPIVDNARHFGRMAAANAISDVYAMGGIPIMALSVLGMPINKLPVEAIQYHIRNDLREILNGGVDICHQAGIPLAGGHSIDSPEPIFGLVVAGLVNPKQVKQNSEAKAGDVLLLTKPLGIGVMATALKNGLLPEEGYAEALSTMTQLNKVGQQLSTVPDVHAMTDVTGFGLCGHLLEMAQGSRVAAEVDYSKVPVLQHGTAMAQQDTFPGAVPRNLESYGKYVDFEPSMPAWQQKLLVDPQTSGSPRAYNIPDRFHPEEDGADPRVRQTVLQQHVEFFDYDKDGVIWPWDTARGFRDIGYNPLISGLAPLFIHSGMSLPTQEGFPNLLLPIHIKNIHKCKHGSDSGVYDTEGRYIPQKFEELMSKYDKDGKGGLTYQEVLEMTSQQSNLYDWFGRIASFLEWTVTYAGFKDENGVLPRDAIRKQFNGSLFYEYAAKMGKSMKEKKGHGKHLQ